MRPTERPVIGFLTDFGLDGAAATCRGVMLSICRDAQIVDICHTIRKYAIADGAFVLAAALPYLPVGNHVAVVDPGVGTSRRPIGIRTGRGDVLIGPDNGLLIPAAEALGGIVEARELENVELWLPEVSATFHGRDIFAPVAARLAQGDTTFPDVGPSLTPDSLMRLDRPRAEVATDRLLTEIVYVDSFGNLRLAAARDQLEGAFADLGPGASLAVRISEASALRVTFADSFGLVDVGATLLYVDSSGNLALAENQGSLARRIGSPAGESVVIERP